jgi:hypothetical protein
MENCSDGFNVPREHTAKLYIVGKRIMGSIGIFFRTNEKWSRFSKIRVKGQISKKIKKITLKLNCLFFFKNPLLSENKMDIICYSAIRQGI